MTNPVIFGFLTGLHLATLQFCYFFLLLVNVTSTYITYATIVIAWMIGTVIGLLWKRLNPGVALGVGVLSYYAAYVLVINNPLSSFTLPAAAVGVAVTGLWAGNFFVFMRPFFERIDRLFLHENNGFLIGIITVFLGFTLLGLPFLLWSPFVSGVVLLLYFLWLKGRESFYVSLSSAGSGAYATAQPRTLIDLARDSGLRMIQSLGSLAIVLNIMLPTWLFIQAGLTGENYWVLFEEERSLINWFSSVQLVVIALVAYLNFGLGTLLKRLGYEIGRHYWVWVIFALGFVFLALDERFEIHKILRDDVLKPEGMFTDVPYIRPGDVLLYFYFAVGLLLTGVLVNELRQRQAALITFGLALTLALAGVMADSLLFEITMSWPLGRFWSSAFEEISEIWGQLMFLLSFLFVLQFRLNLLGNDLTESEGGGT